MFKLIDLTHTDLEKIEKVREYFQQTSNVLLKGGQPSSSNLILPHEVYYLRLDDLRNEDQVKVYPSGIRVVEASDNNFNFIYEIGGKETQAAQIFYDKDFLKDYEVGVEKIVGTNMEKQGYELRTIKVPSLYVDALWLHNQKDSQKDQYLIVRSFGALKKYHLYDSEQFFGILRNEAKNYDEQDPLIGA